jgi:hypothetical protein
MAVRRSAFERVGRFDESIHGRGEEEDWERRYCRSGGRIRYLARAGLDHRRTAEDSRLGVLARSAYRLGRTARRYDVRKDTVPPLAAELRILTGCLWHTLRRRCGYGIVMTAHAAGRIREALPGKARRQATAEQIAARTQPPNDFLSGTSGEVSGIRAVAAAFVADALADLYELALQRRRRLRRAAARWPRRRVLVLAVEREDAPNLLAEARRELLRSRHDVTFVSTTIGGRGKFENLNALMADTPPDGYDWLLVVDDDVALPRDFLDNFIFLAERFQLRLAQPAHRRRSHAAWQVTRRQVRSVLRETGYVEIGPVTAFAAATFESLLPFPDLRFGWGLCAHWSALAEQRGWRIGVVDATAVRHGLRIVASSYRREDAIAEGRRFLADRPYHPTPQLQRTLAAHRTWA